MYFPWTSLPSNAHARGRWAENRAMWYLAIRGWRICARNWIGGGGELDIVACRWKTLLICEVRLRSTGDGFISIDAHKTQCLQRSTRALIRHHKLHAYMPRIDAINVRTNGSIEHRRDVIVLLRPQAPPPR